MNLSMDFKKFQNKILGHMKAFNVTIDYISVQFVGSKLGLYVSFRIPLYVYPLNLRPITLFYRTDCTHRSKFLTHTLNLMLDIQTFMIYSFEIKQWGS